MDTIRILGAGLSGLSTAVLLARGGRKVEVRGRSITGGGRFSGGHQVIENGSSALDALDELEALELKPDCEIYPLHTATLLDPWLNAHEVSSEHPYAYLIRRGPGEGTIDTWILDEAAKAGVSIVEGSKDEQWQPDVIATGPRRADGIAREKVFKTDHPNCIIVLFDPELTPTGYSYLFVHEGWGTIGAAQVRGTKQLKANAEKAFAKLFEAYPMNTEPVREHVQYMNFCIPGSLQVDGTWYVGEAAGVQEFLFGLGNRLAMRTAGLVSTAILEGSFDEKRFDSEIIRSMHNSVLGRFGYELAGKRMTNWVCRYLASADFRKRLVTLQKPNPLRGVAAKVIMKIWNDSERSKVPPTTAWCRTMKGA